MSRDAETGLLRRLGELRAGLSQQDLVELARRCGAELADGCLRMPYWEQLVIIDPADFVARDHLRGVALDQLQQAVIAYYLFTCDGTPPAHAWIAFSELPDGRFYAQAFQGYTGAVLARELGEDVARFAGAAGASGGRQLPFADAAFRFQILPNVPILVACWLGDEDFPSSYKILFDANTAHHMPTDGCAILGSMLTRRLLQ